MLHPYMGFMLRGICPKPTTPLLLGVATTDVEPERKPASKWTKRPRSPSSSPSQIPTLLSPGSACVNYFYVSDLFKGLRFTNFRDFDLKTQATLLHAKALASDCISKINGSKGKKDALSGRMGAKSFFTRVSTQGQCLFKAPLGHSLFFPSKAPVCPCLVPAILPSSLRVNGCTAGQSGAG